MSKFRKGLVIFLGLLIFPGCTMPHTNVYSLYFPSEKKYTEEKINASVSILVRSPRYLSQPYIAYRNSPYQLEISRYAKWDSAPSEMVREAFRDSFSASGVLKDVKSSNFIPAGFYSMEIELRKFERLDTHDVHEGELAFGLTLFSPDGEVLYHSDVVKKVKLPDRTFLSLAQALSGALEESMEEVKARTVKIISSKTPSPPSLRG